MKKARSILTLALLGAVGGVVPTACDGGSTTIVDAIPQQGQVQLNLVGVSNTGAAYRLRQAIIVVQGPSTTTFLDSDRDPDSTTLGATVPTGFYTAFLQEGWLLERLSGSGKGEALRATLLSPNPVSFFVDEGGSTRVPLRFSVGGETLDTGAFDIVLEVEEQQPEAAICSTSADCAAGQTCCLGGFLGTCQALAAGASCALPDLTVSTQAAVESLQLNFESFPASSCAIEEGCVDAPGLRRLLRFTTQTGNIGGSDIVLGDPNTTPGFEFAACHGHFHFESYAEYQLLDASGAVAARGHKQAFCLLDLAPLDIPGSPPTQRFHCGFQGIQRGWSDIYDAGLDCQWVDVTDVPAGDYTLRISINPEHVIPESDFSNNTAEVPVHIGVEAPPDALAACEAVAVSASRDCGWSFAAGLRGETCEPGQLINVGCGCSSGGACGGDPMLRICEGSEGCLVGAAIGLVDDACGLCPETQFLCPPSGVYSVLTAPFRSGTAVVCEPNTVVAVGPGPVPPPLPPVNKPDAGAF